MDTRGRDAWAKDQHGHFVAALLALWYGSEMRASASGASTPKLPLALLFALACWLMVAAPARAAMLGPLLVQHSLWAGPLEPQRTASFPVGTLPSTFNVDDRGAARLSIPLDVPPAARGLEPALSLEHDSQIGNGPLGVGWALGGQSAISRCAKTLAEDGEVAPIRMTNDDALCLDGRRLMLVEGAAFDSGAVYRSKKDDFARVRVIASGGVDGNECHDGFAFEVDRPDHTIATYGCTRDATMMTHLGAQSWALSRVRDRFGNYTDYLYQADHEPVLDDQGAWLGDADVDHRLTSIAYGAHLDLHAPTRHIRFEWERRPDPSTGFFLGAPQRQSQRLTRISTFAPNGLAQRYELNYVTPTITGRSLLHAISQCDGAGVCRPATTFEWEAGTLAIEPSADLGNFNDRFTVPYSLWSGDPYNSDPFVLGQTLLDANGDGRTDMLLGVGDGLMPLEGLGWELWTSQPGAEGEAFCGTSQGDFEACAAQGHYVVHEAARTGELAINTYDDLGFAVPPIYATDYDGDGRDDAIALGENVLYSGGTPPAGHEFYIVRSLAEGGVEQLAFDPDVGPIWWFSAADQDGDGLGDLLFCAGDEQPPQGQQPILGAESWHYVRNEPDLGFVPGNVVDTDIACSAFDKFLELDHDGDGLASLLVIPVWDDGQQWWVPSAKWPDYQALTLDAASGTWTLEPTGLPPDLAQRWRSTLVSSFNDNPLSVDNDMPRSQQGFGRDRVLDVDGDGLPDILRYELTVGDGPADLGIIMNTLVVGDPKLDEWGGVRLWRNTGAGFRDGGLLLEAGEAGDGLFRRFLSSAVLDYDADGRLDLLMPMLAMGGDDWAWSVWRSQGDGTFVEHPHVLEHRVVDHGFSIRALAVYDLDGDALHDLGLFDSGRWGLWEHAGTVPDKLVEIVDGLGVRIEIKHGSITDFSRPEHLYQRELDTCPYPLRCERDPRLVVTEHRLDNGIQGDARVFEHRYGMGRSDRLGRQGLGFRFHETIERDDQHRAIYRQRVDYSHGWDAQRRDFPYAGMPASVLIDSRDPVTGRHLVRSVKRLFDSIDTTPLTYHPYVSQSTARSYDLESCAAEFCVVTDFDEDSRLSDTVDTVFQIDAFGEPTLWTSSSDTGSTLIEYRYERSLVHDPNIWLLGLVTHERETFTELGGEQGERDWTATYDWTTGAQLTRILEPTEPELFLHASLKYDAHGNLTGSTATDIHGIQRPSAVEYDAEGVFPVTGTNALGHASKLAWDPGLGAVIQATDPNGVRIVADYDGLGHITGLRSFVGKTPRGDETTFSYAMLGPNFPGAVLEQRRETAGHGYDVTHFDRLGRVILERAPGLDGVVRDVVTRHDRRGRIARTSLPTPYGQLPDFHEYEYDFAGRMNRHVLSDGTAETWQHIGRDELHVDLGGTISLFKHDLAGRLIASTRALGTVDEERMCFDYGAFEQLVRARPDCVERPPIDGDTVGTPVDPGEAPPTIKEFEHDDLGRLIYTHDPSEGPRSYELNGHGELDRHIDANANEVVLGRDALGRVITRSDVDGQTTWTYDLDHIGALSATLSPDGHEELLEYDAFGRIESSTKIIAGESFELSFGYDAFDRLAEIHYPQAQDVAPFWVRHDYADNGELRAVYSGPDHARLWQVEDLDDRGNVVEERFGNDAVGSRTYDPLRGFVKTIETTSDLGGVLQSLEYQWHHDGTLERRSDTRPGRNDQHETFEYDALDRVTAVHTQSGGQSHDRHFAYDPLGNLVFATDRGEYEYDLDGRLALADGSSYTWDDNGNLLARTGARPVALSYTAFDKPAELDTDREHTYLEYDASQARVYRYSEHDARETVYVTDLYQRHHDEQTGETAHHYHVFGLERAVATVVDTVDFNGAVRSVHYLHTDHIGSTDMVTDDIGTVAERMSFDVWGKRRSPDDWTLPDEFTELGLTNLGYTGHEAQEDAGLMHMRGRLYEPHIGRMVGADPFVIDATSTQGWNRYAYVLNRPLALTDPSGFSPAPDQVVEFDDAETDTIKGDRPIEGGVIGSGVGTQGPGSVMTPGESTDKATQTPGDQGPTVGDMAVDATANGMRWGLDHFSIGKFKPSTPALKMTLGMAETRPREFPSQTRRRYHWSAESGGRVIHANQNPPDHVRVFIGITMIILGGEAEIPASLAQAAAKKLVAKKTARELSEEGGEQAVKAVARSRPSSRKLGEALEAAGHVRPPGSAAHHIVAGNARQAEPARRALERFGIDINDAGNGVFLPKSRATPNPSGVEVHSTVHTNSYYATVNEALDGASSRQEALKVLDDLRQQLIGGDL